MTDDSSPELTPAEIAEAKIREAFPGIGPPLRAAFVVWLPEEQIRQWIKRHES